MKIVYDCLLLSLQTTKLTTACSFTFQTTRGLGEVSNFNIGNNIVDMSTTDVWQFSQIYKIESIVLLLLLCLLTYYIVLYNGRLLSHDKFQLALHMLDKNRTPLTLIRNQLEDIVNENLSEKLSGKLEETLEYTNNVIECYQNVIALDKMAEKALSKFSVIECELNIFIASIIDHCCIYAKTHQVQLKVRENNAYINCRINETIMNAAIQCLFYRIIELTAPKGCVNIAISHTTDHWTLSVSNGEECEKEAKNMLSSFMLLPIYHYSNFKVVRRLIRQHGGKLISRNYGREVNLHLTLPIDCQCQDKKTAVMQLPVLQNIVQPFQKIRADLENEVLKTDKKIHILLMMTDKKFSDYLSETLSALFRISILDDPEMIARNITHLNADIIIVDEIVGGMYGDEICSMVKADEKMANIPIILFLKSNDNESYLSHIKSGADRLENRMVNICRLKADIQMLVENSASYRKRIKELIANNRPAVYSEAIYKDQRDRELMEKVLKLLEDHPLDDKYTVKQLAKDAGLSQTLFYNRIKDITGYSPERLILSFKMDKARDLLLTRKYKIEEIATMVGYADGKYFSKVFKEIYNVCPRKYLEMYAK
ncbi:helix-turn-helix domain-containing protein [uncultured Bacteroides sp.]|uniref:helix-turn-helix domain-containing protein n=1 Tax=uncultured Bacteroides sp. TaxID=162156 RepID=UPI0025F1CE4B|nr:helix-turn-helix domain-containing protein [uncultured Bacteroides sp.]